MNVQTQVMVTDELLDKLVSIGKVLKALSHTDALRIFSMAKDGIEADTGRYSKIGLTRKKYYMRLVQLKNAGLIEKKGKLYFQTTMGSFLHENCIIAVTHALENSKKMAMIDVLRRKGSFAEEDLSQMKSAVCRMPLGGVR